MDSAMKKCRMYVVKPIVSSLNFKTILYLGFLAFSLGCFFLNSSNLDELIMPHHDDIGYGYPAPAASVTALGGSATVNQPHHLNHHHAGNSIDANNGSEKIDLHNATKLNGDSDEDRRLPQQQQQQQGRRQQQQHATPARNHHKYSGDQMDKIKHIISDQSNDDHDDVDDDDDVDEAHDQEDHEDHDDHNVGGDNDHDVGGDDDDDDDDDDEGHHESIHDHESDTHRIDNLELHGNQLSTINNENHQLVLEQSIHGNNDSDQLAAAAGVVINVDHGDGGDPNNNHDGGDAGKNIQDNPSHQNNGHEYNDERIQEINPSEHHNGDGDEDIHHQITYNSYQDSQPSSSSSSSSVIMNNNISPDNINNINQETIVLPTTISHDDINDHDRNNYSFSYTDDIGDNKKQINDTFYYNDDNYTNHGDDHDNSNNTNYNDNVNNDNNNSNADNNGYENNNSNIYATENANNNIYNNYNNNDNNYNYHSNPIPNYNDANDGNNSNANDVTNNSYNYTSTNNPNANHSDNNNGNDNNNSTDHIASNNYNYAYDTNPNPNYSDNNNNNHNNANDNHYNNTYYNDNASGNNYNHTYYTNNASDNNYNNPYYNTNESKPEERDGINDNLLCRSPAVHSNYEEYMGGTPGGCDLAVGTWVREEEEGGAGPAYTSGTCGGFIHGNQDCERNGRPDTGYLRWRWRPRGCELPRFDARLFLRAMAGRSMLFVGDSLARNHFESLFCSLSQVEPVEVGAWWEHMELLNYTFPSYNFTLGAVWAPFLVAHQMDEPRPPKLHIDRLHELWTTTLPKYNVVVFSGAYWLHRLGTYYINDQNVTLVDPDDPTCPQPVVAMKLVWKNLFDHVLAHFKGTVVLRTISVSHFETNTWDNGGTCNKTQPDLTYIDPQNMGLQWQHDVVYKIQREAFAKAVAENERRARGNLKLRLLDVTYSTIMRPDGHPSVYRTQKSSEWRSDCLHWCLPGPIDTWNQLLLADRQIMCAS